MRNINYKWTLGLSIASLLIAIAALTIAWSMHDIPLLPDFSATAVGILSTLVTLLVAWQIYNALQVEDKLKDNEERGRQAIEEWKSSFNTTIEQALKEFRASGEEYRKKADDMAKLMESMKIAPIHATMALDAFNTPQRLARELSKIGVGELNDWKNSVAGVDWYEYMSITPYYVFGDGDYTKIQSNIALYLVGEKDYAKSLEIVLNIGYQQDKQEALNLFKRTIKQVEQLLNAGIDMLWIENKIEVGGDIELEKCTLTLSKEEFELISTYKLTIQAKPKS